jgi:catechol 2,3-dioxygenase-like lactoylglutathione lyase family enzyme
MNTQRFHVHVHVADLDANLRFYSQLFGSEPSVRRSDYAKWMLDDPSLNFAISTGKSGETGIAHLGLQARTPDVLAAIGARLQAADAVTLAEAGTTCCYARSDKYWAEDPQGLHWETFHTHGEATSYYAPADGQAVSGATCCPPREAADATAATCGPASCAVPAEEQVVAAGARACCA